MMSDLSIIPIFLGGAGRQVVLSKYIRIVVVVIIIGNMRDNNNHIQAHSSNSCHHMS